MKKQALLTIFLADFRFAKNFFLSITDMKIDTSKWVSDSVIAHFMLEIARLQDACTLQIYKSSCLANLTCIEIY